MCAIRKQNILSRIHYVDIGDFKQLSAISPTEEHIRTQSVSIPFDYRKQIRLQFERSYKGRRMAVALLMTQYRLHCILSFLFHTARFSSVDDRRGAFCERFHEKTAREERIAPGTIH